MLEKGQLRLGFHTFGDHTHAEDSRAVKNEKPQKNISPFVASGKAWLKRFPYG